MSDEATNFTEETEARRHLIGTVIADGYFTDKLKAKTELVVVRYDDGIVLIWRAEDLHSA